MGTTSKIKSVVDDLPVGVIKADLAPAKKYTDALYGVGDGGRLTFYKTTGFGWCVATLHIRNASSRSAHGGQRTYAARCEDGGVVRIGLGPHILKTVTVFITKPRVKVLQRYIDMYSSGVADANQIRDRISSRRAEGALRRSRGETSWMWGKY
jgi:hypothetical protein